MFSDQLATPIGNLLIEADHSAVFSIQFREKSDIRPNVLTEIAKTQLEAYFKGENLTFSFPMQQEGTPFQQKVWETLQSIKAGYPISYADLSVKLENPLAIRAIAAANGKNNLLIAVPCHRVIGSTGKLVGYAGELWRKKWLLEHEARIIGIGQTSLFL